MKNIMVYFIVMSFFSSVCLWPAVIYNLDNPILSFNLLPWYEEGNSFKGYYNFPYIKSIDTSYNLILPDGGMYDPYYYGRRVSLGPSVTLNNDNIRWNTLGVSGPVTGAAVYLSLGFDGGISAVYQDDYDGSNTSVLFLSSDYPQ